MMTELETTVYNTVFNHCCADYSSSVREVADKTGLAIETVKGAAGSLVKKGALRAETETRGGKEFMDLFPRNEDGQILSFGDWC
jgi:hypothetical protein